MDEISKLRGYLWGVLIMLGIVLVGYALNPVIGVLGIVQLVWPQNLYFVVLLAGVGMALGMLSESVRLKATNIGLILPSFMALGALALIVFIWPNGIGSLFINILLATPGFFLFVFVFLSGGAFIASKLSSLKKSWAPIVVMLSFLLFCYSTVVTQRDYYQLSMRIGEERALFEAEDTDGKFYRLPFAIKLLPVEDGIDKTMVRLFNTVQDFKDVAIDNETDYRLKGWVIGLKKQVDEVVEMNRLVDLSLVFDRWIELKYISLGLLIVSLLIRLRY